MIFWSSILGDRFALAVRAVAIGAATLVTSVTDVRHALALGSAQISAFLIARLIERPQSAEIVLSIGALFVTPFSPAFLLCPAVVIWIYIRRHTRWFAPGASVSSDVMSTVRDLSSKGSLDPVSIARSLLQELKTLSGFSAATVIVGSRPLASLGQLSHPDFSTPLHINGRTIGEINLSGVSKVSGPALALIEEGSVRLETALLFTEARVMAGAAERSRMARDMHDGVAQELASIGYMLDELLAAAPEQLRPDLRSLRNELTRVISDLRLSIFELRTSTLESLGFGAALSDYVQQVRESAPFKIHLTMDEGTERLSEEVEQELLRIVQEALANARRHSQAGNVWISCQIRAPRASIAIDDDGVGLQTGRGDSFGMSIMSERATQIGARVTVGNRDDGGTTVKVELDR